MSASTTIPVLSAASLAQALKRKALDLGFDLVGIAPAAPSARTGYVRDWLASGTAGEMTYLTRRIEERVDPAVYLPGARSVICVAINYHVRLDPVADTELHRRGRIARYALGDDYHEVIKTRLHALADWLREQAPEARTRAAVDTAPVLERELAARAGIGWVGKHTGVLNAHVGSWLLLGEVLTTLDLPADAPATDHCGSCTRCIDACPTGAITEPYRLDARRCISYLTIEHRGEIDADLRPKIGNWLYGCDVCQDVCPHNREAPVATDPALRPRFPTRTLDAQDVSGWDEETYRERLRGSAMKRVKLPMLKRNAGIVAENLSREDRND